MNLSEITISYNNLHLGVCLVHVNDNFNAAIIYSDFHGIQSLTADNIIEQNFRNRGMIAQSFMRSLYFLAKD